VDTVARAYREAKALCRTCPAHSTEVSDPKYTLSESIDLPIDCSAAAALSIPRDIAPSCIAI